MSDKKGMILITLDGEDITFSTSKLSTRKILNLLIGVIKETYEYEIADPRATNTYKNDLRQKIMKGIHEALYCGDGGKKDE